MSLSVEAVAVAKKYTDNSIKGISGTLAGKNCTIKSIQKVDGVSTITFEWTADDGTVKTSTMNVMDGKDGKDGLNGKDGSDGIGISKIEKISTVDLVDTYRITFTDNSTFDYEVKNGKDGQSGGTAEVPIEKIKVNGELQTPVNKVVDITVPSIEGLTKDEDLATVAKSGSYEDLINKPTIPDITGLATETWVNEQGFLTEHQDISGKVDKVEGKSLISDTEIERLAGVDNYDDTQVKTQIQAVANGLMDSVGYSADYKTIDIIAKNGVKKSIDVAPIISHASITELSDVDTTNKATGKALVYNATTSKHEYADVSGTDEKVKMDASTDAKYLGELLDNVTIANENGELKVKKLDGQEVTITEINYLKGLTMNVMDLVNMFSNGGVKIINTPVATYAELLTLDKSSFIEGVSYLVYVLTDETHDNAKTTYLVDKDSETPTYFGFADSQRDFTTNPIDLATEITGKLGIANMDSDAIKALFTVDDTYKTETTTNNAFSTHGAKALYDELLLAIGNKANSSDLVAHKDDTDIHVSTEDRTNWDSAKTHADSAHAPSNAQANVLETVKVNGTALEVSNKAVNVTVPTTVAELTDSADYAKKTDIPTTLPANGGNSDTVNNHTVKSDVPENAVFTDTIYDDTEVQKRLSDNGYGELAGGKNLANFSKLGTKTSNGITFEYQSNGSIKASGTVSIDANVYTPLELTKTRLYKGCWYTTSVKSSNPNSIAKVFFTNKGDTTTLQMPETADLYYYIQFVPKGSTNNNLTAGTVIDEVLYPQIEEGTQATEYEPYFPSNKMLAEENAQQNTEAMDLKMLGWTVPSECPIQNEVSGNQFIQKVGRVDLGTLNWSYSSDTTRFSTTEITDYKKKDSDSNTWVANAFLKGYNTVSGNNTASDSYDKSIGFNGINNMFFVRNTSYTDTTTFKNAMQGQYLYYELATEISMNVDGNEAVTKVNDSLGALGKCKNLLNSTLQTTTINGVTCTNNGDGTYTLNGTATQNTDFTFFDNLEKYQHLKNRTVKLVGCPKGGSDTTYQLMLQLQKAPWPSANDIGKGSSVTVDNNDNWACWIRIYKDATVSNLTFKPMLVYDDKTPNATYDDFVPYTGEGDTLSHDVAELKNDLSDKSHLILGFNKDEQYQEVYNCRMYLNGTDLYVQTNNGGNLLKISGATLLV